MRPESLSRPPLFTHISPIWIRFGKKNQTRRNLRSDPNRDIRPIRFDLPTNAPLRYRFPNHQCSHILSRMRNSCSHFLPSLLDLKDGPLIRRNSPVFVVIILIIRFSFPIRTIYASITRPVISLKWSTRIVSFSFSLHFPFPGILRLRSYVSASPHLAFPPDPFRNCLSVVRKYAENSARNFIYATSLSIFIPNFTVAVCRLISSLNWYVFRILLFLKDVANSQSVKPCFSSTQIPILSNIHSRSPSGFLTPFPNSLWAIFLDRLFAFPNQIRWTHRVTQMVILIGQISISSLSPHSDHL